MSDTPRTDAAVALTSQHRYDDGFGDVEFGWVQASFARDLEKENAALRAEVKVTRQNYEEYKSENTTLREDKERLDWMESADYWADIAVYRTPKGLRAAIDAARKEAQP